jgi:hypothetical protein
MDLAKLNWAAVIVAAIANPVVAAIWYAPALFGERWLALLSNYRRRGSAPGAAYPLVLVGAVVTAIVLALLAQWVGATSVWSGVLLGLLVWLGFVVAANAGHFVFEGRPLGLISLTAGYQLVALVIMGGIVGGWR